MTIDTASNKPIIAYTDLTGIHLLKLNIMGDFEEFAFWDTPASGRVIGLQYNAATSELFMAYNIARIPYGTGVTIQVLKWNSGTGWSDLGNPTVDQAWDFDLQLTTTSQQPVIAYFHATNWIDKSIRVARWDGTSQWIDLGVVSSKYSGKLSLAINSNDEPIVAFSDYLGADQIEVKQLSGSQWETLGLVGYTPAHQPISLAISHSDDKPVIAYSDDKAGKKIHIKKLK